MKNILLESIRIDGGTQIRTETNNEAVNEYSAAIKDGATLPPVVVFFDGVDHWLADGFHRYWSYTRAGKVSIPVDIRPGDKRAAWLHALGANDTNGLRRTASDKRNAATSALKDDELSHWSDREIARQCHVSHPFVAQIRASLTGNVTSDKPAERTYKTKQGTEAVMQTANIGKLPKEYDTSGAVADPSSDAGAPDDAEMQANALAEQADAKYLNDLINADEPTAFIHAENKRLNLEVAQLKVSRDGFMRELNEYKKITAKVQRENDRLRKPK